jgi:hypothetical protein
MSYKGKVKKWLSEASKLENLSEGNIRYDEGHGERMHPSLVKQLRERKHSLGDHPVFPDSDESTFEEKLMSGRFNDVRDNYKRQFEVESIEHGDLDRITAEQLFESMKIEQAHKAELEKLAVEMIKKEYAIDDEDMEIIAELTPNIGLDGTQKNPSPIVIEDMDFDNHDSITSANDEVYKRRFINAMIQGASKKSSHMFHLVDNQLTKMDPRLPSKYSKLMAAADYSYLTNDDNKPTSPGGLVRVEFPKEEGGKPTIHAKAMAFPILVHELCKGVMEILSSHGLPEDAKLTEYVIGKADFLQAEKWDMRLGPALWERFTSCVRAEDFDLKHHVYAEMCALPVNEFNSVVREVMAGTKEGKRWIASKLDEIKEEIKEDEYNSAMDSSGDDTMGLDDLDNINLDDLF